MAQWEDIKEDQQAKVVILIFTIFSKVQSVSSLRMKDKLEFKEAKGTNKSAKSNGKHDHHPEHSHINGNMKQQHQHLYTSHSPYQMQNQSPTTKLKTEASSSHFNQQQYIQIMQLDFQATIRGYEIKLKNLNEEYRRNKQQMENKLKELFKEKNHWQNLAIRYSQQTRTEKSLDAQDDKSHQKVDRLESERNVILKQKEDISKDLKLIKIENEQLKQKLSELMKGDNRNNKYNTQPRINRSLTPPCKSTQNQSHLNIAPPPLAKELQMYKMACEKMKALITDLNQQLLFQKIQSLNQKYAKDGMVCNVHIPQRYMNPLNKETSGYLSFNHSHSKHKNR